MLAEKDSFAEDLQKKVQNNSKIPTYLQVINKTNEKVSEEKKSK